MATAELVAPFPKLRFVDSNGNALSGGKLFTYTGGTTSKANTFTDSTGNTANTNPIVLDTRGECNCWIPPNTNFKFVLSPSTDTDPPTNAIWTVDNVSISVPATSIIACTATGTNTIALTPTSGSVTAYTDQQEFSFYAAATNTGATTINVASIGAKNLYLSDGVTAAVAGSLVSGQFYEVVYSSAANSNAGGFIIASPILVSAANTIRGNNTGAKAATADLSISQVAVMLGLRGWISGLTLSNDGTTPNSVLDIAVGSAMDSTAATMMTLSSAFTKSTGGAWAAGSGSNGMGSGLTITASTWYHVFLIVNSGAVDVYFDTDPGAANKPTNTTAFRRIGSFETDGSAHIVTFVQVGDKFVRKTSSPDQTNVTPTTASRTLYTLAGVPSGVQVDADVTIQFTSTAAASVNWLITSPDETDQAISSNLIDSQSPASTSSGERFLIRTNTSQQIGIRASSTNAAFWIGTRGWTDTRGRFN